jgi:hypothetical protein
MLSAVAVSVEGKPGPGFYTLARELGRAATDDEDQSYWREELEAAYTTGVSSGVCKWLSC